MKSHMKNSADFRSFETETPRYIEDKGKRIFGKQAEQHGLTMTIL